MYRILVICTANICRSPVGQVFLERFLQNQKVQVDSAGTLALNGNVADATMQELLTERGYSNITTHRSQALMPSLIQKYDLLLCMTDEHRNQVTKMSPIATGKVKLFGHWDQQAQVLDPIGGPRVEYESSVEQIEKLSKLWADKLIQLGVCA
ncbi:low molecular weight protein-tyrosine-phosphatase [Polynucleobacter kasalickyi]|uniref:protein-tyrosine-phosphatase n=1 Tax=Polynucleobacter kasalickyi TaxID=1938817 RepID=A0A1W2CAX6_9BURK|nr:low molecular weight protein-tyrosine-phosphatase [Polynucleobacter kasalickyi]SMC82281.1 protein tyrosine phosphatase [Polynucleobacter kasalickyi]